MKRTRVGNVDVIALVDTVQAYPAAGVYPKAGDAIKAYSRYLDSEGRVALNFGCFALRDGATTILVDTGLGPESNGQLLAELDAAGVRREAISAVIFTHLHGDHTGWNLERATGKPNFPNASYLVPRGDWDHYSSQGAPSFVRDVAPLEALGRLDLIDGERVLTQACVALPTPGHTPGHTSIAISSGSERGFILGDVVLSPIDAEEPSLENSFDWDSAMAGETRKRILERLSGDGSLVGGSHLPAPGLGHFALAKGKTAWQPL